MGYEEEEEYPDEMADEENFDMHEHIDLMQLNLLSIDLHQKLLFKTIKMLEKSWFWRFRRQKTKVNMILENYEIFKMLMVED